MSVHRKTALVTVERSDFDGNYFDSLTHAKMFRSYKPYDMGVRSAQLYSSKLKSDLINKKFTYFTVAQKNTMMLPGGVDDYSWKLVSDKSRVFRISGVYVDSDAQPGKGGQQFKIALDTPAVMEPVLLKTESSNAPLLRIIGQPKQVSANSWEYVVELQTGNMNAWIPTEFLQEDRQIVDAGTAVSDELNQKHGGDYYDDMFKLQSFVGNYARKVEFTDKFIRTEIACRKEGRSLPKNSSYGIGGDSYSDGAISVGYVYQQSLKDQTSGKTIQKGVFVSQAEARLEERIMHDREMNMEFGEQQITKDYDTGRPTKIAAGYKQLVKEGHYFAHNGSLTLIELEDYITNIFATRKNFMDRTIKIATGEGGISFLHRLVAAEASSLNIVNDKYISSRTDPAGVHENELEYGFQFTKIKLLNGVTVEFIYDPIKDDETLFPEKAPGSVHTVQSYTMDIFDFGVTDQTPQGASTSQNMTMVYQDGVERYSSFSNVYNFETGAIKDGSNSFGLSKELGIYRECSGSLGIFDVSRIGRIEFVPSFVA
jgi:hypothetical protein